MTNQAARAVALFLLKKSGRENCDIDIQYPADLLREMSEIIDAAVHHRAEPPAEPRESVVGCADCLRPYGDEHGFPDLLIPDWAWNFIAPRDEGGGLLCPSCICKRLHDANIQCEGSWRSGPLFDLGKEELRNLAGSLSQALAGKTRTFSEVRARAAELIRFDHAAAGPEFGTLPAGNTPATVEAAGAPLRFRITYGDFGYKVSIPNYKGGEVVAAADYDALRATHDAELDKLREALRTSAENNHSFHAINGNGDYIRLIECEVEACAAVCKVLEGTK